MPERIGFACVWDADRKGTWSHIPANLLAALQAQGEVVDLPLEHRDVLTRLHHRQNRASAQPEWVPRPWNNALRTLTLVRAVSKSGVDKVLEINDLAPTRRPYWLYRDMTWRQVEEYGGDSATGVINPRIVSRQAARERRLIKRAEGVFTFSEWAAKSARSEGARRVVVVPPGVNVPQGVSRAWRPARDRRNLLFVGRAFERKGGREVVEAFAYLLQEMPDLRLTVVGPGVWPTGVHRPPRVDFLGSVPPDRLGDVFSEADLFVLPSRFEAYGIALVEALGAGLPCVAREVCAMPEILDGGRWGRLVSPDAGPSEIAAAIRQALLDDDLHRRTSADAAQTARDNTWDRAAARMLQAMRR